MDNAVYYFIKCESVQGMKIMAFHSQNYLFQKVNFTVMTKKIHAIKL